MKVFRDPVHNLINLDTNDKKLNELIMKLIDSKEFQRLRFINQLGFVYLSFPSATHSRFEHSLGVAFLAKRFVEKIISIETKILELDNHSQHKEELEEFFEKIKRDKGLAMVAALLHDVGHSPLSHITEDVLGFKHEEWTRDIILGNTEINRHLKEFDENFPQAVCDVLSGSKREEYPISKFISGSIDVDKIDYLLRDSHMTGSQFGVFDLEWLINALAVGVKDDQVELGLDYIKGLGIAEDFVMSRIYMYTHVYLYKTNLVAQNMLKLIFERLRELPKEQSLSLMPDGSLKTLIFHDKTESPLNLDDYLGVSDVDLFYLLKTLRKSTDETLKMLSSGILERRLFKKISDQEWIGTKHFLEKEKGGNSKYHAVTLGFEAKSARLTYRPTVDRIFLFEKNGTAHEIFEKSQIIASNVHNRESFLGHFVDPNFHPENSDKVKLEVEEIKRKIEPRIDRDTVEKLILLSIEEAEKSEDEHRDDGKISPKVGAVLSDLDGNVLLTAHRGKGGHGHHCEFSLITEAKEKGLNLKESVLFVTLEPCTVRGEGKIPCTQRILDEGIPVVYIGSLDINDDITGDGETTLKSKGVWVERYEHRYERKISAMNFKFEEQQRAFREARRRQDQGLR